MLEKQKEKNMTFNEFEEKVEELLVLREKAAGNAQSEEFQKYNGLFWELYNAVLELEKSEKIKKEPGKKNIGYLKEILANDGPEYCYTIEFWPRGEEEKRYRIGVCVRGWPILEKADDGKGQRGERKKKRLLGWLKKEK